MNETALARVAEYAIEEAERQRRLVIQANYERDGYRGTVRALVAGIVKRELGKEDTSSMYGGVIWNGLAP